MARATKVLYPAAVAVSAATLAMVALIPASAATVPTGSVVVGSVSTAPEDVAANKKLVTYFYDQLFNHNNYSVIDTLLSPQFIQHNPTVANGPEALRQFVISMRAKFPDNHNTIERVTGQGDLVVIHHHAISVPGTAGTAIIDIFRVSGGKVAEHWDVLQPVPTTTASGNDMFTGLVATGDTTTKRSEAVVRDYFTRLTQRRDLTAVDHLVAPSLVQHDPALPNGSAAVKSAFAAAFQAHPGLSFSSLKVVADGDLVTLRYHRQSDAADLGQAVTEIFRVNRGQIVEHWSVEEAVPATSANDNTMF
jgi:predicted SnoaL-like aldol condensation-catalyzing enzyme